MSNEEHSASEFYYLEEQETSVERKACPHDQHFDKVEASGDTGMQI